MTAATRVLVTGATGFIGGHLCRRLIENGYTVRALVRESGRCEHLTSAGVELAVGDVRDSASLRRAVRDVDVVYHLAAVFRKGNVSARDMWAVHVDGTKALLEAAAEARVARFVHCSTAGVHGEIKNPPATEETPYGPGDPYQNSKTAGERLALHYMTEGRLPVVIVRPAGVYGPGDLRFRKLIKAINTRTFVMLGRGTIQYQLVFIDDLIDGIIRCGTHENAVGNVYLLTGDAPVTLNDLVRLIANVLQVPPPRWRFPVAPVYAAGFLCELLCKPLKIDPPLHRRRVDFFRKTRAFDISKAKRELGYQPRFGLPCGLMRTVEWYRSTGLL